jgi:hypothetical protein
MPNGVFADAWLIITPIPARRQKGVKFVIPCEDVYEARAISHMLVVTGAPRKCVAVSGGYLPARPPNGGVYQIITVEDAVSLTVVDD